MPVYKKNREQWRVVIFHKGTRQDFILSGTKEDADAFEARKRVEILSHDQDAMIRDPMSFENFVKGAYRAHAKTHLKERTWSNRSYALATMIEHLGKMRLCDIRLADVEAFKAARIKDKIKATTINDDLKVLRAVLAHAKELGHPLIEFTIKDLPTRGVKRRVTFWTDAQVRQLFAAIHAKSPQIEPLVAFLLNTGCRKGEALALEWRNVDLQRRMIYIEPSEEWQPKDGEARQIPISDALMPYLVPRRTTDRYVFAPRVRRHVSKHDGERYAVWPQLQFDRARLAAGIEGGPHTTRHTYASHFLARSPDLFLLAKILGHSTSYVTELYGHLLPDHLERARNVVNFGLPPMLAAEPERRRIRV